MLRHMTLQTIKLYAKKFGPEFGQIYLACDHSSWRKQYFKYYKANRKKTRDASDMDWDEVFSWLDTVKQELIDFSPYKVLHVNGAEADDIIATLVHRTQIPDPGPLGFGGDKEKVMIVSSDKDFLQLQKFSNVKQFSSVRKKLLTEKDPNRYLFTHLIKGDSGDGVPNVFSDDDTFVTDKRQTPVRKTKLEAMYENWRHTGEVPADIKRNFDRNQLMIDLDYIPEDIKAVINAEIERVETIPSPNINKFMTYLVSKRCSKLLPAIKDFYIK
jgi:hypothetical protein